MGGSHLMLAAPPRHFLNLHAAARTTDSTHQIQQKDREPPHGDKLKSSHSQMIVSRSRLMAHRTFPFGAGPRSHLDFNRLCLFDDSRTHVNKAGESITAV